MLFGCPLEFEMFPILAFSAPGPPLPDLEEIDAGGPWVVGEWDSSDNRFTGSFTWLNCIQPVGFLNLLTFFGMFSLLHRFFIHRPGGFQTGPQAVRTMLTMVNGLIPGTPTPAWPVGNHYFPWLLLLVLP